MTANPSDKAILKSFKHLKDKAAFTAALSKLRTVPTQDAFRDLHAALLQGGQTPLPLEPMAILLGGRMTEAAEFVFVKFESAIAGLSIESVLRIAPTSKCLQLWVAAGGKHKKTEKEDRLAMAGERFRQSPAAAMQTALARWFIEHVPAPLLPDAIPLFTAKHESSSFTRIEDILGLAVRRDKDGKLTSKLLMACSLCGDALCRTLALVRSDAALFDEFARVFVAAVEGLSIDVRQATVKGLIGDVKLGKLLHGRELSRRLLSLGTQLLRAPASEQVHGVLAELDHLSDELQKTIVEGQVDKDFCGIRYHGRLRQAPTATISAEVAKHLAITISEIRSDTDPVLAIEATAFNLGMRGIQIVGESIAFDPSIHEDARGGALRGDIVSVLQPGWRLGDQVIERAKVQRV